MELYETFLQDSITQKRSNDGLKGHGPFHLEIKGEIGIRNFLDYLLSSQNI